MHHLEEKALSPKLVYLLKTIVIQSVNKFIVYNDDIIKFYNEGKQKR